MVSYQNKPLVSVYVPTYIIFIPQYGVVAAAYTTMISFFVMFVMGFMLRTALYRKVVVQETSPDTM